MEDSKVYCLQERRHGRGTDEQLKTQTFEKYPERGSIVQFRMGCPSTTNL